MKKNKILIGVISIMFAGIITLGIIECNLYGGNGNLLTTKTSNKNEHGIGIKRINEIVKKYNGIIEFDPGTEIFSVSILFPLDNWLEDN